MPEATIITKTYWR